MKASEMGMCTEVHVSSGGYVHICAFENKHKDFHRCACGESFDEKEVKQTARKRKKVNIID